MFPTLDGNDDDGAIAELGRLISAHLLHGHFVAGDGTSLEFRGSTEDFKDRILAAVAESIADLPKDRLFAILMSKTRMERRQENQPVLTDGELPPGFSCN